MCLVPLCAVLNNRERLWCLNWNSAWGCLQTALRPAGQQPAWAVLCVQSSDCPRTQLCWPSCLGCSGTLCSAARPEPWAKPKSTWQFWATSSSLRDTLEVIAFRNRFKQLLYACNWGQKILNFFQENILSFLPKIGCILGICEVFYKNQESCQEWWASSWLVLHLAAICEKTRGKRQFKSKKE